MIIDTSALLAILLNESEAAEFTKKIISSRIKLLPAPAYLESRLKIHALSPSGIVDFENLLVELNISIHPIDEVVTRIAADAHLNYGKGMHPAGLNFGDCFSYALSKHLKLPLLFKGNDFSQTDINKA